MVECSWELDVELISSYVSQIDADYLVVDLALDSAWEKAVTSNNKIKL